MAASLREFYRVQAVLLGSMLRALILCTFFSVRPRQHTCASCPLSLVGTIPMTFIHSIAMCRMRQFLAVLRSFFHSSLLRTFSCHPSAPTILPSSLTSSCHLLLGLLLSFVVPKFKYNTLLGILFSSILCTCPNQRNLFNLIVSIIAGFLTLV